MWKRRLHVHSKLTPFFGYFKAQRKVSCRESCSSQNPCYLSLRAHSKTKLKINWDCGRKANAFSVLSGHCFYFDIYLHFFSLKNGRRILREKGWSLNIATKFSLQAREKISVAILPFLHLSVIFFKLAFIILSIHTAQNLVTKKIFGCSILAIT